MPIKTVIAASEGAPYVKTGGLGDVAGALPAALSRLGAEVALFLPYYRQIAQSGVKVKPTGWDVSVRTGARTIKPVVLKAIDSLAPAYFIVCDEFFDRTGLYGTPAGDYFDNIERYAFFSRAVLESCKAGGIRPDVIHCNDWQTALIPAYLKGPYSTDSYFNRTATLFTIHNLAYQGLFDGNLFSLTGLDADQYTSEGLEFWGRVNLLKAGLVYADIINTVSRAYSFEIQTAEYGCGLDGVLATRKTDLYGVLNGVDYEEWNPGTDILIPENYNAADLAGKPICKKALVKNFGLKIRPGTPLIGMISRLAAQKGFDILVEAIESIRDYNFGLVILGSGDKPYQDLVERLAVSLPGKVGAKFAFDNKIAHLIEAGSDMFLMPSKYEPCGLNQMYSFRYGTVPIVRATGGLDDTVTDWGGGEGNGFKFAQYSPEALADKIKEAFAAYTDKAAWETLIKRIMKEDFSWGASAKNYLEIYKLAVEKHAL